MGAGESGPGKSQHQGMKPGTLAWHWPTHSVTLNTSPRLQPQFPSDFTMNGL